MSERQDKKKASILKGILIHILKADPELFPDIKIPSGVRKKESLLETLLTVKAASELEKKTKENLNVEEKE